MLPVCASVVQSAYAGWKTASTNSLMNFCNCGSPFAVPYWSAWARFTSTGAVGYLGTEIVLVFSFVEASPKSRQNQESDEPDD